MLYCISSSDFRYGSQIVHSFNFDVGIVYIETKKKNQKPKTKILFCGHREVQWTNKNSVECSHPFRWLCVCVCVCEWSVRARNRNFVGIFMWIDDCDDMFIAIICVSSIKFKYNNSNHTKRNDKIPWHWELVYIHMREPCLCVSACVILFCKQNLHAHVCVCANCTNMLSPSHTLCIYVEYYLINKPGKSARLHVIVFVVHECRNDLAFGTWQCNQCTTTIDNETNIDTSFMRA